MDSNTRVLKAVGAWLFLLVLAVAAAAVTIALVNKYLYGPTTDVRAYVEDLRDGEGGEALGLLNAEVPEADAAMLDGAPLEAAAGSLEDVEVSTVEDSGDGGAAVRAEYVLDGQQHSSQFDLHPVDTQWGFFTVWAFDGSRLPVVEVSLPGASSVDLNGTAVALPGSSGEFAVFYPGVYTASYDSELVRAEPRTAVVTGPGQRARIELEAEPTDRLREEVDRQLREHLEGCAEQDTLYPAGCPFSYEFDGRVAGEVEWSIVEHPEPEIVVGTRGGGGWGLEPARGTARIAFDSLDLFTGEVERVEREVPFEVSADLAVDRSTVTVTPRG
ncbi:hypothetical protein AS188_15565 [Kocuria flava]|uniref:Uncharacterized protein n=1 Tax=Kocuria flava TaxID=446860 RepID=A0A0U3GKZ9_9MICC|nr:hypothetical protein [Kocuria flava]ALU40926.1 hypothetical protein AS188_15565 [Kocuria flava]GEO92201.1 hypothetical protein KFL01_15070 [Kocuria flava]